MEQTQATATNGQPPAGEPIYASELHRRIARTSAAFSSVGEWEGFGLVRLRSEREIFGYCKGRTIAGVAFLEILCGDPRCPYADCAGMKPMTEITSITPFTELQAQQEWEKRRAGPATTPPDNQFFDALLGHLLNQRRPGRAA